MGCAAVTAKRVRRRMRLDKRYNKFIDSSTAARRDARAAVKAAAASKRAARAKAGDKA